MEYTVKELIEKLQTLEPNRKVHILGQGLREGVIGSDVKVETITEYESRYGEDETDYTLENYSIYDILIH